MSFPGARWRCQLIARGRGRAAGWGPGSQLPARNYREKTRAAAALKLVIDPSAGPRSSLTAADPGRARGRGLAGTPRHPPAPAHPAVHRPAQLTALVLLLRESAPAGQPDAWESWSILRNWARGRSWILILGETCAPLRHACLVANGSIYTNYSFRLFLVF